MFEHTCGTLMYCFHEPKLSKAFLEIFISVCVFHVYYGVAEAFETDESD